jgi:3-isopropylmalate dehydrogenase
MLPSASLGAQKSPSVRVGLYEPVHGSAPDIAGQDKANPLGAIGSVAAMLEYSFGLIDEAKAVSDAIEHVLDSGRVTADLKAAGRPASTTEVGDAICEFLSKSHVTVAAN